MSSTRPTREARGSTRSSRPLPADGRLAKSERRRRAVVDATMGLVARAGTGAVTHRAVAAEAGLSSSSVAYHFATVDDLLVAALTASVHDYRHWLDEEGAGPADPGELAGYLVDCLTRDRARVVAEFELYLLAARRPVLRPAARAWLDFGEALARRFTTDPVAVRAFVAALDGFMLQSLLTDRPPTEQETNTLLAHLLPTTTRPSPGA